MTNIPSYVQAFSITDCPGWMAREHHNGKWSGIFGTFITPDFDTFLALKNYVRNEYFTAEELRDPSPECSHGYSNSCPDCDVASHLKPVLDTHAGISVDNTSARVPRIGDRLPNGATVVASKGKNEQWIVLCIRPQNSQPYVTWAGTTREDSEEVYTYTGHYHSSFKPAYLDYEIRS